MMINSGLPNVLNVEEISAMKLMKFCLVLLLVSACNRQSEVATPDVDAAPGNPGSVSTVVIVHNAVIHTVNAEQDIRPAGMVF